MSAISDELPNVSHKDSHSSAELLSLLFNLPNEKLIEDYSCAISESILLHGRMYVTYKAICFYSNIFGKETRKIIPFSMVDSIRKKTTAFLIPALEFVVRGRSKKNTRNVLFTSFLSHNRDSCYKLCVQLHRHYRPDAYLEDPMNTTGTESPAATPSRRQSNDKPSSTVTNSSDAPGGRSPHPRKASSFHLNITADSSSSSAHFYNTPTSLESSGKLKSSKSIREAVTAIVASRRSTMDLSLQDQYKGRMTPHRYDSQGSEFIQFGYFSPSSADENGHAFGSSSDVKDTIDDNNAYSRGTQRSLNSPGASLRHGSHSRSVRATHSQKSSDIEMIPEHLADEKMTMDRSERATSPSSSIITAKPTVETVPLESEGPVSASTTIHKITPTDEEPIAVSQQEDITMAGEIKTSASDSVPTDVAGPSQLTGGDANFVGIDKHAEALPPNNGEVPKSLWTRLEGMTLLSDICAPCTVEEFNTFFLSDNAAYSILQLHESQGDKDVQSDAWKPVDSSQDNFVESKSKGEDAEATPSASLSRTIRLRMPLSIPLAPKETAVEKVQKLSRYTTSDASGDDSTILCLDTVARSFDVPYGDHFVTEEVILLTSVSAKLGIENKALPTSEAIDMAMQWEDAVPNKLCRLMHFVTVTFNKSTWFKGKIISETTSSVGAVSKAYIEILKKELAKIRQNEAAASIAASQSKTSVPSVGRIVSQDSGDVNAVDPSGYDKDEETDEADVRRDGNNRQVTHEGLGGQVHGLSLHPLSTVEDARGGVQSWAPSRSHTVTPNMRRGVPRSTPKSAHMHKSSSFVVGSRGNSPSRHSIYVQDHTRSSPFASPARRNVSKPSAPSATGASQGIGGSHSRSSSTFAPTVHGSAEAMYPTANKSILVRNKNGQLVDPLVEPFMTPEMAQRENRERLFRAYLQLFGGFQSVVSQIRVLQNEVETVKKEKLELEEEHAKEIDEIQATLSNKISSTLGSVFIRLNAKVPFIDTIGDNSNMRTTVVIFGSFIVLLMSVFLAYVFWSPYPRSYIRFFGSDTPASSLAGLDGSLPTGASPESIFNDLPDEVIEKIVARLQQRLVSDAIV